MLQDADKEPSHVPEKGGRRRDRDDSGDERLDSGSCASSSTLASLRDLESNDLQLVEEGDPFDRCIDALYEKRCVHMLSSTIVASE